MEYFATPKSQKSDDLEVTGISRSGRVRKKSSKLVDFESPDDFTEYKLKRQKAQQQAHQQAQQLHAQQLLEKYEKQLEQQQLEEEKLQNANSVQQTNSIQQENSFHQTNSSQQSNSFHQTNVFQQRQNSVPTMVQYKTEIKDESTSENEEESEDSDSGSANGLDNDDKSSMDSTSDDDEVDPLMMDETVTEIETTGFTKLEPPEQTDLPSQAKSSLYMLEKYKKKLIIKDGKVINKTTKTQRKDKGKTRFTAYMLWAKEARQQLVEHHPNLDFATISKRLGEMWATVPNLEKYNWRKRAKRLALKPPPPINNEKMLPPSRKFINKIGSRDISPKKTIQLGSPVVGNRVPASPPSNKVGKDLYNESFLGTEIYKVTGTQPIDIAAHLTLLGESLTIIGKRLKEHEGQITVSGSLPLLLDSLLCALGPLLCLTQQIPEMNGANPERLSTILENVAYIMPGL